MKNAILNDDKTLKAKLAAIKKEKKRLMEICEDFPENKKALAIGLIENIAFQRIELKHLRDFLSANGWTELFSQSEKQEPYSRIRPEADIFVRTLSLYSKNIKTLSEIAPKPVKGLTDESDGFESFVESRDRA